MYLLIILLLPTYADAGTLLKNNMPRCELKVPKEAPTMPIRGTGYYWVEYLYDGFPGNKQLILLIRSKNPMYDFHGTEKSTKFACEELTIIAYLWITASPERPYIDSFDCHWADDAPYPIGDVYFGYVERRGRGRVGLHRAVESWKINIKGDGKGGTIKKMHPSSRVYCTVLPGIDG